MISPARLSRNRVTACWPVPKTIATPNSVDSEVNPSETPGFPIAITPTNALKLPTAIFTSACRSGKLYGLSPAGLQPLMGWP